MIYFWGILEETEKGHMCERIYQAQSTGTLASMSMPSKVLLLLFDDEFERIDPSEQITLRLSTK